MSSPAKVRLEAKYVLWAILQRAEIIAITLKAEEHVGCSTKFKPFKPIYPKNIL